MKWRDPRRLEAESASDTQIYCVHTGTVTIEAECRLRDGQNDPTNQLIACSDGSRVLYPYGKCPVKPEVRCALPSQGTVFIQVSMASGVAQTMTNSISVHLLRAR